MAVIILSKSNNVHADAIEKSLSGHDSIRIDADTLSSEPSQFYSIQKDTLVVKDRRLLPSEVKGVFIHHFNIEQPVGDADPLDKQLWISAWRNYLQWLEYALPEAVWINRPSSMAQSSPIRLQLNVASDIGFNIPECLFTNSQDELITFANTHGELIVKTGPLLAGNLPEGRILSHKVTPGQIDGSILKNSPCLFQKYIEKEFELRVYVIGELVLCCQILSQQSEKSKIDWRNYDLANVPHYPFQLDPATEKMCVSLVKRLGLSMGAIDLIVKKNGDILFLECNSQGHWLWIEALTGLEITNAICRHLLA